MTRVLPEGWERATLGDIGEVSGGLTKNGKRAELPLKRPYLRVANVYANCLKLDDVAEIGLSQQEIVKTTLKEGDLLIVEGNGSVDQIGRVAMWDGSVPGCVHQNHIIRARFSDKELSAWTLHWLLSSEGRKAIEEQASSSAGLHTLSISKVSDLSLPIAPRAEQRRIVEKIEALTARSGRAREALAALPALLDRYRAAVLAAAFRGNLTAEWRESHPLSDAEPALAAIAAARAAIPAGRQGRLTEDPSRPAVALGDLPDSWRVTSLDALTDPARKIQYGILMPGPDVPGGVPYVKVMNMRDDRIDITSLKRTTPEIHRQFERASLKAGDLLLSIRGTYGRVAVVPPELDGGNVTQDTVRIAPLPGVNRDFLALFLRSPAAQNYFDQIAKGVAVRGINVGDVRPMEVPFPPAEEQAEIVRITINSLQQMQRLVEGGNSAAASIPTLDSAILAKAFRGELVPQDPTDEPASFLLERICAERVAAGTKRKSRR